MTNSIQSRSYCFPDRMPQLVYRRNWLGILLHSFASLIFPAGWLLSIHITTGKGIASMETTIPVVPRLASNKERNASGASVL